MDMKRLAHSPLSLYQSRHTSQPMCLLPSSTSRLAPLQVRERALLRSLRQNRATPAGLKLVHRVGICDTGYSVSLYVHT